MDRPRCITVIAVVNAFAAVLTIAFWGLVLARLFAPGAVAPAGMDAGSVSTVFGFMVGDLVWAVLTLVVAAAGLWRMKAWGWVAAQMVNILWIYSLTVIWCRDLHLGSISPGAVLFSPFVLFSVWAVFHLWHVRDRFAWGAAPARDADPAGIE